MRNCLVGSILGSSIIAILIILSISRPLKRLEDAARRIGDGNFDIEVNVKAKDEIGNVGEAFNTMTKKLFEYKQAIESKNDQLAKNLKITEDQKKDLEKVNKELDRFAHTVSHDLRAPLTGIAGYGAYLVKNFKEKLDERGKGCLEGIERSANRMNALINDLLALTKISRVKNPYEDISVSEIVNPILERLEFTINELDAKVIIQDNLPTIRCDRIKLGEVFLNLINNAIKFSSKNTKENKNQLTVEVGCNDKENVYEFFVKDNGIGIAKEHHGDVFGVFKRLHNVREYDGTGAGLSIVKNVVEDHGGEVWIDSQAGDGATFYFTIPKKLE